MQNCWTGLMVIWAKVWSEHNYFSILFDVSNFLRAPQTDLCKLGPGQLMPGQLGPRAKLFLGRTVGSNYCVVHGGEKRGNRDYVASSGNPGCNYPIIKALWHPFPCHQRALNSCQAIIALALFSRKSQVFQASNLCHCHHLHWWHTWSLLQLMERQGRLCCLLNDDRSVLLSPSPLYNPVHLISD